VPEKTISKRADTTIKKSSCDHESRKYDPSSMINPKVTAFNKASVVKKKVKKKSISAEISRIVAPLVK
jgi:hypothetical protein